jgi:malate synthase
VDFGLHVFHTAPLLIANGDGPYYYLPKLESHLEARLWNDVFAFAQDRLGIPQGTIRATVLIETIPAAFEMDEILFELREHASGLNAGRWDYLFSIIKVFRDAGPEFVVPDRASVSMTAPFMRAYTELLVKTCHRRGAVAMGGMAAFVPNRSDPEATATAFEKVRADKTREADDGFDGSWVAHPDLVPVCREVFDGVLGDRPNQLDRQRPEVEVSAAELLDVASAGGAVTEAGLRTNLSVAVAYTAAWLEGSGAVALHSLMEDAATAEISRSQVWQQLRHGVVLADTGRTMTREHVREVLDEEVAAFRAEVPPDRFAASYEPAARLVADLVLADDYVDFLTLPAYELLE